MHYIIDIILVDNIYIAYKRRRKSQKGAEIARERRGGPLGRDMAQSNAPTGAVFLNWPRRNPTAKGIKSVHRPKAYAGGRFASQVAPPLRYIALPIHHGEGCSSRSK
jgi:hypothetical protein